jgi:hypothetical protein
MTSTYISKTRAIWRLRAILSVIQQWSGEVMYYGGGHGGYRCAYTDSININNN